MTHYSAAVVAHAPYLSANNVSTPLYDIIRGRSTARSGPSLPQFSVATLQFLKKLSPSLQKAALSAILKSKLPTLQKLTKTKPTDTTTAGATTTATTTTTTKPIATTTETTTTSPTTTTTSTTTGSTVSTKKQSALTPSHPTVKNFRTPPSFHWDDEVDDSNMSWANEYAKDAFQDNKLDNVNRMGVPTTTSSGDAGIVLLVSIFNLLAVVIYAAHRHLTNIPSLPSRVLDWQVQKVLDELVLRVHSSRGAAQLLARALPDGVPTREFSGRSSSGLASPSSLKILENAKAIMLQVASSPTASSTASLPMGLYRPLTTLYATVFDDLTNFLSEGGSFSDLGNLIEGRSLNLDKSKVHPTWLQIAHGASQLNGIQWDGVLRTLTILGRSRSLASSETIARALMSALISPEGTARNLLNIQSLARAASRLNDVTRTDYNGRGFLDSEDISSMMGGMPGNDTSRVMRRMGYVEDASGLTGAGGEMAGDHWAHRWFALVTRLAPVALDATTLYARAHSEPMCLRSLLCTINFSWKKVGPLQGAMTPLLSVLTGWALEDRAPHSLGDSLSAIRAGWLGRDCAALYPECSISKAPENIVAQALTYFSRLEISINEKSQAKLQTYPELTQPPQNREDDLIIYDEYNNDLHDHSDDNRRPSGHVPQPNLKTNNDYYTHYDHNDQNRHSNNENNKEDTMIHKENNRFDYNNNSETDMPGGEDRNLYETVNPHDSYELYRREAYGVDLAELKRHRVVNGRPGGHSNDQTDGVIHIKKENEKDDRDYHSQKEDKTPVPHTTTRNRVYQRRNGEGYLLSPLYEDEYAPSAPPYERYDSLPWEGDETSFSDNVITGMAPQDAPAAASVMDSLPSTAEREVSSLKFDQSSLKSISPSSGSDRKTYMSRDTHYLQRSNVDDQISQLPLNKPEKHRHHGLFEDYNLSPYTEVRHVKQHVPQSQQTDRQKEHMLHEHQFQIQLHQHHKHPESDTSKRHSIKPESIDYQKTDQKQKRPGMYLTNSAHGKVPPKSQHPKSRVLFPEISSDYSNSAPVEKEIWFNDVRHTHTTSISSRPHYINGTMHIKENQPRLNSKVTTDKGIKSDSLKTYPGTVDNLNIGAPSNGDSQKHFDELSPTTFLRTVSTQIDFDKNSSRDDPKLSNAPTRKQPKYKYGLRRGLPAVTVNNFSKIRQSTQSTSHLSRITRPWYTYDSTSRRKLKNGHKTGPKWRTKQTTEEAPVPARAVAEFGPADAVTDERRNNLLFEYIRDQKRETTTGELEGQAVTVTAASAL